ncbi:mitogen-activated protein kinase kinase kinase 5-like [Arachis stenosperma]|uniref:mitogen-activated protein kinase kinase kinase 5-like n=1 Tax=Arachis stenosperma TaxID=217475 RepID=UPI0025AC664B|nr:mitogen-activated protein kinase kinase kinase 5-like [Arachis stenosperma]
MRWIHLTFTKDKDKNNYYASSSSSSSSSSSPVVENHKKTWRFRSGNKKRLNNDGKSGNIYKKHVDVEEEAALAITTTSPSGIRTTSTSSSASASSSAMPLPLPLPQRDAESRQPSPVRTSSGASSNGYRSAEDRDQTDAAAAVNGSSFTGFKMRSVFASNRDTRRKADQVENRLSPRSQENYCLSHSGRSGSSSPFASPKISPCSTDDFVPYHYVAPKGNQFWSAPEITNSESSIHPIFDLSGSGPETSPKGRPQLLHVKSSSGPPSPLHGGMMNETASARRAEGNSVSVHRLPLPPMPNSPTLTAATTYSHAAGRSESLPMKSQWKKGKLIGRGTFGSVYVGTNRETGALCAVKEVELCHEDPTSIESIKQLEQEIKVLSQLKHPNIVQYYGSEVVEDKFNIYLEYVHPGSINKYVRDHCGAITESVVRNFTRHILSGLAYLHSKKTIHRDIKGANLLVDSAGVVKLADFGMSKHLNGYEGNLSLKGSPYWMAPELMQTVVMHKDNNSDLAYATDIWSLGCTIIEMFNGKPPWSEFEGAAAMFKVMKDTPPIPETLSSDGKDFLRCCFRRNPAERPTAAMLLEHRFLKNSQPMDVTPSTQLYNGTTIMDKTLGPHSPTGHLENIPDQISISCEKIAKLKAAERRGILIPSLDILPAYQRQ